MLHLSKLAKTFLPFCFPVLWRLSHSYNPSHAECIFTKAWGSGKLGHHPGRLGEDIQAGRAQCRESLWSLWSFPEVKLGALWKLASSSRSWISAHWGNWEVTVKTYLTISDLIWFYNRPLRVKKSTECQREGKMGLKLFKSGADWREWLTKAPLMLTHLTCMIPITLCAAVCPFTSRVKLSLAL